MRRDLFPAVKIRLHSLDLPLRHTFTISRGSQEVAHVLIVELENDGIIGFGETSPSGYYGQSVASVREDLESILPWLKGQNPLEYRLLLEEAAERLRSNTQALCALDLALHDWIGKKFGQPIYRLLGLRAGPIPRTSYTIGLDTIPKMTAKLREFAAFPIFKIKLGTREDVEIVRALRQESRAVFRVDANCAWSAEETIEKSRALKELDVEFIEQPLPPDKLDDMEKVFGESALPVIADENACVPSDIPRLAGRFHGINIKLVKCGGLQPALKMIAMARALGMKIMLGCMVESSNACTAAAHLGSLVDWLDLDGPLLVAEDPFDGMNIAEGRITLPDSPGLGVRFIGRGLGG